MIRTLHVPARRSSPAGSRVHGKQRVPGARALAQGQQFVWQRPVQLAFFWSP